MHRSSFVLVIAFLIAVPSFASGPGDRQPTDPKSITSPVSAGAKPVPINDLFYSRRITDQSWSPDGKEVVITTNFTGRFNLWKVSAAGGWPTQLLQSDDRQFNPFWSRDGKWIVFQQDAGGHERYDLYAVPSSGGQPINLTNTPHISEDNPRFSYDGKMLAYTVKPEDSPTINIAVMDWATRKQRIITDEKSPDHYWQIIDFTRDGKTIFAIRGNAPFTDSSVWRIDIASARAEELTPHQGDVLIAGTSISPDGTLLLLTSGEKDGYNNVALLNLKTKKKTWITDTQWDAGSGEFSPDGRQFTYALNHDGQTDIYLQTVGQTTAQKLDFPPGQTFASALPTAFSPDGTRLMVSHEDSQRVGDLWIYDLKTRSARQLTQSAIASLSPSSVPPAQIVHYKSFDGQIISAYLWMPFNLKRDGSNPAIVLPHGGPTGQIRNAFDARAAALASRGYICIGPNVRGSTGYGLAFQKANIKDLGGGDLQDEVYATKFLLETGFVDPKKIGIAGGSYGGYMTLMAIGKVPEIWAAAVDQYGVINWKTMATNADPFLQQYVKGLLGDPEKDREIYENTSPLKYIRNEKAPLLVLQGENDIRVPKEESEQVVSILKQEGHTVDAHYYPQEGHGFSKRENQIDALKRMVDWFEKYMPAASLPASQEH
ncbi:MAG TPA: S9 family peptidase [Candidatus Angelobacter sp.]